MGNKGMRLTLPFSLSRPNLSLPLRPFSCLDNLALHLSSHKRFRVIPLKPSHRRCLCPTSVGTKLHTTGHPKICEFFSSHLRCLWPTSVIPKLCEFFFQFWLEIFGFFVRISHHTHARIQSHTHTHTLTDAIFVTFILFFSDLMFLGHTIYICGLIMG